MEKKLPVLNYDFSKLPEYQGAKEKQESIVKDNPFVTVIDNTTYELAKKRRTALRQGRFDLQKGEKAINSDISNKVKVFKDFVSNETTTLIDITLNHENTQQEEIDKYEEVKKAEKAERDRIEKERIEKVKNLILEFRSEFQTKIANCTFENVKEIGSDIETADLDAEEFQQDFEIIKEQLLDQLKEKKQRLDEAETLRKEREKIAKERKAFEVQQKKQADKVKAQQAKANAKRKEQQQEIDEQKAQLREQKEKIDEAEKKRKTEAAYRESLIDTAIELSGNTRKHAENMTNDELNSEIKRLQALKEKERADALKSDKEKTLDIIMTLDLKLGPKNHIKDAGLNKILADYLDRVTALRIEFIEKVKDYR